MFPELEQTAAEPELLHGIPPRGLDSAAAAVGHGRFGRMFPALEPCNLSDDGIAALLTAMDSDNSLGENPFIPAGFTYLGQFIDHDITFDPNSQIDKAVDPFALTNFRTPRLDLDSLYGSGPADQPYLYDWDDDPDPGVKLLLASRPGATRPDGTQDTIDDLPRNHKHRALIGDPRNDVHLVIAQLHLLFLRFHNHVVDHVRETQQLSGAELFREAYRMVRWHYQWIVVHDFLPLVAGPAAARVIKPDGAWPPVERRHFRWEGEPFIPVEFSGAVYRFGHSMVRDTYEIHRRDADPPQGEEVPELEMPEASPALGPLKAEIVPKKPAVLSVKPGSAPAGVTSDRTHLTGFRDLIPELVVGWDCFFATGPQPPQPSMCIDTGVAIRMSSIPSSIAHDHSLPRLNLQRGRALGLPSGQDVARAIGEPPLTAEELFPKGAAVKFPEKLRKSLVRSTPLWYYVLAEATSKRGSRGVHLGPVGGIIVAEVLMGLLEGDPQSYLSQAPAWKPELRGAEVNKFTMVDLVNFANRPSATRPEPRRRTERRRAADRGEGPADFEAEVAS